MPRIVFADGFASVREGLQIDENGERDAGVGPDSVDGEALVLLNVDHSNIETLSLRQNLKSVYEQLPMVVIGHEVSAHHPLGFTQTVMNDRMITKSNSLSELISALRSLNAKLAKTASEQSVDDQKKTKEEWQQVTLSEREKEVLQGLTREQTLSNIAEELQISVKTVDTYKRRICDKLKVSSTAGIIRYAYDTGLLKLTE